LRAQLACGGLGLVGVGDRAQHDDSLRAGVEHVADVRRVQAADREERHVGVRGGVAHQLDADGRTAELRRRLVDGSDTDVVDERRAVGVGRSGRVDLRLGVRREADQHVVAEQRADVGDGRVVLSDVRAVGADLARDERAVVDDQQRADPLAQRARGVRDGGELVVGELLVAQLHDVDAAGDSRADHVGQLAPAGFGVADQIQPRGGDPRASFAAEVVHRAPKSFMQSSLAGPACVESADCPRASINAMRESHGSADLLVVGGGVIGLSIAWRARELGMSVAVLERDELGSGTSRVAAGMLAPVAEAEFGEDGRRALALGLRSAELWPAFAERLEAAGEQDVGYLRTGTLLLARDDDEARALERQIAFRDSLGLTTSRLRASEAREREPALAPALRLALETPDDHSVDPRLVLSALRTACVSAGVSIREHARVTRIECDERGERVTGVVLADAVARSAADGEGAAGGERVAGERVVIACGAWSGEIGGLPVGTSIPVRPVRGQLLRLRDTGGPGLLSRVVRFGGGYVVPRADGRYVLGATVEERGFDVQPDVGGVYELMRDAHELLPGVSELKIEELCVGLRPGTPDNAPAIGFGEPDGLLWATGHYRNGILLAPLTAEIVVALLSGESIEPELSSACAPERFAAQAVAS
jgi:glycine oxidase